MAEKPSVLLVFGGQSTEHQISCLTAASVSQAIDTNRFEVHGVAIAKDGSWHRINLAEIAALYKAGQTLPEVDPSHPSAFIWRDTAGQVELATRLDGQLVDHVRIDVALPLLHGPYGEDGTIQGFFEMLGLPYVGSGVAASAIGMDKHLMKVALSAAGLPVGPYQVIMPGQWQQDAASIKARILAELAMPLFVKPARGGSSVGIVRVDDASELDSAIAEASKYDPKLVIEQGIMNAREIECAVLGPKENCQVRASVAGEIKVLGANSFYDFEAKYRPHGEVNLLIPTQLTEAELAQLQALAKRTFTALGCEGLGRVDTFLTEDGQFLVNEINTMPGFTELSMFPQLWAYSGLNYPDLIADLLEQALTRSRSVVR